MINVIKGWFEKHFSDPQAVILIFILVLGAILVLYWGSVLTPVLAGIVIAYILEGLVCRFTRFGLPRFIAFLFSYTLFLTALALILFGLVPLVISQLSQLITDFPQILDKIQQLILDVSERYPIFADQEIEKMLGSFSSELVSVGQKVVSVSLSSVVDVFTVLVYLVVVPLLVFFLLKDKSEILDWFRRFLPEDRGLAFSVWKEVDVKMGNYIRGKLLEVFVVGVATFIPLKFMGMNYAATMSLLVGLSVIIPYVGAVAVTIPVAMIAWFQWGASSDFVYLMVAYLVVQFIDGNILVPLLFSEVVNMHPAAIIIAVLFFGGLWGVWGVFFAIPLATLLQAVIHSWPSLQAKAKA
ncbi:Putative permease PerM (= YfgO) [hydrothermal vent metagenome]|uniref:Permease PerM (= YfgO) n=1 Tax=hydrothermal vent metagenome TaxID=652676 RepID=A0A3B0W373_9ZZZZ